MAGSASMVPFGGRPNLGSFKAKMFNMFNDDHVVEYEDLRTKAQNPASGIAIDNIKEYVKKTSTSETEGDSTIKSVVEELYMFVQWWEKQVEPKRGDTNAEVADGIRSFSTERPTGTRG